MDDFAEFLGFLDVMKKKQENADIELWQCNTPEEMKAYIDQELDKKMNPFRQI